MLVGLRARGPAFRPGEALRLLDKNPRLWVRNGVHKPVRECVKEPLTAQATAALRAAKQVMAADQGVQAPKVTVLDLYALLRRKVSAALTTPPHARQDLIAYVKQHCATALQALAGIHFGPGSPANAGAEHHSIER